MPLSHYSHPGLGPRGTACMAARHDGLLRLAAAPSGQPAAAQRFEDCAATPLCPPALHTKTPSTCPPAPQVFNPKNKLQQAFVITLGRAGEDNRSFRLTDIDSTLAGFAGADYDMLVRGSGELLVCHCASVETERGCLCAVNVLVMRGAGGALNFASGGKERGCLCTRFCWCWEGEGAVHSICCCRAGRRFRAVRPRTGTCRHWACHSPFSSGRADRCCGAHRLVPRGRRPALLWCARGCCCCFLSHVWEAAACILLPCGG